MDPVSVEKVLKINYEFLESLYVSEIAECDFGFLAWSICDYDESDTLWNHGTITEEHNLNEVLDRVEEFYEEKEKTPAVYIPDRCDQDNLIERIQLKGYSKAFTDVWMFYSEKKVLNPSKKVDLEKVSSDEEMEKFVDVFYQSHTADLDDPYAGLSDEYGKQLREKFNKGNRAELNHFIVKLGDKQVGHVTSIRDDDIAALYNLGTIPGFREQGVGTSALEKAIVKLENQGAETIFLQTEKGSENEDFFESRGFETRFTATCLSRNQ